jgi:hypothetical protein
MAAITSSASELGSGESGKEKEKRARDPTK